MSSAGWTEGVVAGGSVSSAGWTEGVGHGGAWRTGGGETRSGGEGEAGVRGGGRFGDEAIEYVGDEFDGGPHGGGHLLAVGDGSGSLAEEAGPLASRL